MENNSLTAFVKSIEIVSKSLNQQMETLRKVTEAMTAGIRAVEQFGKSIAQFFEKTIYLTPELYKVYLDLRVNISPEEIEKRLEEGTLDPEDIYTVYTTDESSSKFKTTSFKVTEDVAKAISLLIKNRPQYMYVETKGIVFNEDKPSLEINGVQIPLKRGTRRYDLCKYMFKGKRPKKMPWELEDLVEATGADFYNSDKNWYQTIYRTYRTFNDLIYEKTGKKRFFLIENKRFKINPMYLSEI